MTTPLTIDDGGYAFPGARGLQFNDGMTLRAYYAGQALNAMLSNQAAVMNIVQEAGENDEMYSETAARLAFEYADDMIARMRKNEMTGEVSKKPSKGAETVVGMDEVDLEIGPTTSGRVHFAVPSVGKVILDLEAAKRAHRRLTEVISEIERK